MGGGDGEGNEDSNDTDADFGEMGEDQWEDEDEDEDEEVDHGLPQLSGEDACIIVDKSGVHQLQVHGCKCISHPPLDLQFPDMGLFPASLSRIRTAFTFSVLDNFRMDNLECKTARLRYYSKLKRLTLNCFPQSVPVRNLVDLHS